MSWFIFTLRRSLRWYLEVRKDKFLLIDPSKLTTNLRYRILPMFLYQAQ